MKFLAAKRRTALDLLRASVHSAPQSLERTAQIFNNIDDRAILKAVEQVNFLTSLTKYPLTFLSMF